MSHTPKAQYCLQEEGGAYSLIATLEGKRKTLYHFTKNEEEARAFLRLLQEEDVSPLHMIDVWEDGQALACAFSEAILLKQNYEAWACPHEAFASQK